MARSRDISKVLSSNSTLATDAEVAASYLTTASASTVYQTKASAGLTLLTPTSIANTSGTASIGANGTITFSGVSNVSLNGVFSSTYKNYRINFDNIIMPVGAGGTDLLLRLRANGTNTTTNYTGAGFYMSHNSATVTGATVSSIFIANTDSNSGKAYGYIDLFAPFEVQETIASYAKPYRYAAGTSGSYTHSYAFFQTDSTQFDGFSLVFGAGTGSGAVSVYGYNK